jgi:hypothetical protein
VGDDDSASGADWAGGNCAIRAISYIYYYFTIYRPLLGGTVSCLVGE